MSARGKDTHGDTSRVVTGSFTVTCPLQLPMFYSNPMNFCLVSCMTFIFMLGPARDVAGFTMEEADFCEKTYADVCPEKPEAQNLHDRMECLRGKMDTLVSPCKELVRFLIEKYDWVIYGCDGDLKELCNINFDTLYANSRDSEILGCVMANWDRLASDCQELINRSMPSFPSWDRKVMAFEWRRKQTGGVTVEKRAGDFVWYTAQLKRKKVLAQYEFCPQGGRDDLEIEFNPHIPACSYKVGEPWAFDLIEELEANDSLQNVSHGGLEEKSTKKADSFIKEIVARYDKYCPDGFDVNVINYGAGRQRVRCSRKERFDCPPGYTKTYPDKDNYFGCRLLESCQDTDPDYFEFGDTRYCAACPAGGFVDVDKTYCDMLGDNVALCKIKSADFEE